jgi:hypothetical protein
MRATRSAHIIILGVITVIIFGEYNLLDTLRSSFILVLLHLS